MQIGGWNFAGFDLLEHDGAEQDLAPQVLPRSLRRRGALSGIDLALADFQLLYLGFGAAIFSSSFGISVLLAVDGWRALCVGVVMGVALDRTAVAHRA